jgi:hypothetical protein
MMSVVFKERLMALNTGFKSEILVISIMLHSGHTINIDMQLTIHQPSVIVIDDFYHDPHAVKQIAINSEYHPPSMVGPHPQNFAGSLSLQNYHPAGLSQYISKLLGKHVHSIPKKEHGYFRYALPDDKPASFVHCDVQLNERGESKVNYSLVVYLTESIPAADLHGTMFFQHKKLGCTTATLENQSVTSQDLTDPQLWNLDHVVGFKWNRAVLFDSALFHTPGPGFGNTKEDARCVQVFGFHNFENA